MNSRAKILLWSSNIWYLGEGMLGPLFAVFSQRVGGDVFQIASAWSVYLFIRGLAQIITGRFSDGHGRKEILSVVGFFLSAGATFCYLFVHSQTSLLLVQVLLGIGTAIATPTWVSLYAQAEDRGSEGSEWGLMYGSIDMIVALALVIGGWIVSNYSFYALFIVMGSIKTVAALIQTRILYKT